jgi:rfaE bifunctional protein kinase chain/domain
MDQPIPQDRWLNACLGTCAKSRVTVFGDFCLDAYWLIDTNDSELSVETGLPVRRVREQHYSLGGASNVAANLAALGVGQVRAVSMVGDDIFGAKLLDLLAGLNVDCSGMLQCQSDWQTMVFSKPCIGDAEQNRIDFGGFNVPASDTMDLLAEALSKAAAESDIVILNQQVPAGVSPVEMIERINAVVAANPQCMFIVDSRHRAELYAGCMLKVNAHEALRILGHERPLDERVSADEARDATLRLFEKTGKTVFVTRGENGIATVDSSGLREAPGIQIVERVDPVGAGDTTVSAIAAALGGGADAETAARVANIAASITVRKLQTTGTASPEEIRQIGPMPDYVYLPELADDPRKATYLHETEVELIRELPGPIAIGHAIFDHDGTISTLREGWEEIMEPMMAHAILGPCFDNADEPLYHKVLDTVRVFIDKTTGIQTLVQMQGLVELVRQFGCVPETDILDIHGYKALYNEALLEMVRERTAKLQRGELNTNDFLIKNALALLETLHAQGIKLYLASGTDETDVKSEAEAMGYAHLFEGRIFGAVGDINVEAKRIVLERIIGENNLSGSEFATFGDGPVEMRETRKRGGIAVGVASDEVRRFGLNPTKRARLIRAGADIIVPDFSQLGSLSKLLNVTP